MRLLLTNPKLAGRSCQSCKQWLYIEDGPHAGQVATRGGKPVPRGDAKTPCRTCPKQSPELAYKHELNAKSLAIFWDYKRAKATQGGYFGGLTPCKRTSHLFAICETILDDHDKSVQAEVAAQILTAKFA